MMKGRNLGGKSTPRRLNATNVITCLLIMSACFIAYSMLSFDNPELANLGGSAVKNSLAATWREYTSVLGSNAENEHVDENAGSSDSGTPEKRPGLRNGAAKRATAENLECPPPGGDKVWCDVPPPESSHYGFKDVRWDARRWRQAQIQAAAGEQVLLSRIIKQFPNPYNYIDGDRSFRGLQKLVDVFVDSKTKLDPLLPGRQSNDWSPIRRKLDQSDEMKSSGDTVKALHVDGQQIVPLPYNFRLSKRAPVVEMGYTAFEKNLNNFFSGNFVGGNFVKKEWFFDEWDKVHDQLDHPFITMCSLNENWGVLSTNFPNRTAGWGACCNKPKDRNLHKFLNHEKTLMFVINQHSNISHPKLLTLPRGLPSQWEHTARLVWDTQREIQRTLKKQKLLFAASSSWGKRPQILRCISDKMETKDFWGHSDAAEDTKREAAKTKTSRRLYYQKLGTAMIGVALPGLGYDCFRTWELLTMGTVVVLERGVGLDRTLWRLPALLVEDFYDITPELLRSAYVEALYRADEFEFERLTQSFWYDVIYNVSDSHSVQPMLDKFPMEAELPNFARPKEPYACSNSGTCGPGTKRTPRNMC